jgi:hypothetical protein
MAACETSIKHAVQAVEVNTAAEGYWKVSYSYET